jgi:hypothetical protein
VGVVIELNSARPSSVAPPPSALIGDLQRLVGALSRDGNILQRFGESLEALCGGLDRLKDQMAVEGRYARWMAALAEQVSAAIEAGDDDALTALQDEVRRARPVLSAERPSAG